jgi:hypothetical protein
MAKNMPAAGFWSRRENAARIPTNPPKMSMSHGNLNWIWPCTQCVIYIHNILIATIQSLCNYTISLSDKYRRASSIVQTFIPLPPNIHHFRPHLHSFGTRSERNFTSFKKFCTTFSQKYKTTTCVLDNNT